MTVGSLSKKFIHQKQAADCQATSPPELQTNMQMVHLEIHRHISLFASACSPQSCRTGPGHVNRCTCHHGESESSMYFISTDFGLLFACYVTLKSSADRKESAHLVLMRNGTGTDPQHHTNK